MTTQLHQKTQNSGGETQVSEIDHKMKNWTPNDQQNHMTFKSAKLIKVQDEIMTQYLFWDETQKNHTTNNWWIQDLKMNQ